MSTMFKVAFTTEEGISCEMFNDIVHFNADIGGVTVVGEEVGYSFKDGVLEEEIIAFKGRVGELMYKVEQFKKFCEEY